MFQMFLIFQTFIPVRFFLYKVGLFLNLLLTFELWINNRWGLFSAHESSWPPEGSRQQ